MAVKRLTITLHDETEITVTPNIADRLAFESTLRKHPRWGSLRDNGIRFQTFLAWSAGRRAGLIEQSWEDFTEGDAAAIDIADADQATPIEEDGDALGEDTPADQPMS